jgi:hypothetical protein
MAAVALYLLGLLRGSSNLNTSKALHGKILEIVLHTEKCGLRLKEERCSTVPSQLSSEAPGSLRGVLLCT